MRAIRAFLRGWAALARCKAALTIVWLFFALVALIVAAPAASMSMQMLGHSRMAGRLLERFDVAWFGEQLIPLGTAMAGFGPALVLTVVMAWLGSVLLAGGVIAQLNENPECFRLGPFLAGAGRNFWRFFRLSLFGLLGCGLALLIGSVPGMIVSAIYKDGMEAWPMGVAGIVDSVLIVLLLGWMVTVTDYAKVRLVVDDARSGVMAWLRSFAFVLRHFGTTMGIWALNALVFLIVLAVYLRMSNIMHPTAPGAIALLFVVQQVFVLFRTAQRIAVWGAAVDVYQELKPVPPVAAVVEETPVQAPVEEVEPAALAPVEPNEAPAEPAEPPVEAPVESAAAEAQPPAEAGEAGGSGV